ncbi:MAG: membrane protein insertase YidC [Thermoanaerobaculia bacterium]
MEKRIFSAVLISIGLLWLWAAVAPRLFPDLMKRPVPAASTLVPETTPPRPAPTAAASTSTTATAAATPLGQAQPPGAAPIAAVPVGGSQLTESIVDAPNFVARFSNRGATLVSFQLKNYQAKDGSQVELVKARDAGRTDFPFAIESSDANVSRKANSALYQVNDRTESGTRILEYRFSDGSLSVTKTFRISSQYLFHYEVAVSPSTAYRIAIGPGIRTLEREEKDSQFIITGNGVVQRDDSLKVVAREKADKTSLLGTVQYVGIEDNYFLSVLRPDKPSVGVIHAIDVPAGAKNDLRRELYAAVNAGPDGQLAGSAFFGPKETYTLDQYGLEKTLQFGMFGIIARFLLVGLTAINKYTHNYGFAIIVLTILIKIVLYPLQHKWIVSMKKMQKMQPKMEAIKARYKKAKTDPDQRQKMNADMMKLYQQEGINPAGGCLPFALQVPILWGFYNLLSHAIELRHAPFILWIHDLSAKDPYYITPLLMMITMFIQQAMTPTTGDAMQKRMFYIMPLVMGWIFKELPSGVVLYYLMQNVLTILQQLIMNKFWKDQPAET